MPIARAAVLVVLLLVLAGCSTTDRYGHIAYVLTHNHETGPNTGFAPRFYPKDKGYSYQLSESERVSLDLHIEECVNDPGVWSDASSNKPLATAIFLQCMDQKGWAFDPGGYTIT